MFEMCDATKRTLTGVNTRGTDFLVAEAIDRNVNANAKGGVRGVRESEILIEIPDFHV